MAFFLQSGLLESLGAKDLQKLMIKDVNNAANGGKSKVDFIAAKKFKASDNKATALFILCKNTKPFEAILKKNAYPFATGTCDLTKENGKSKVIVAKPTGSLNEAGVADLAGNLLNVETSTKGLEMAKASHAQARDEGKLDWEFKPDPQITKVLGKVALESSEFAKFAGNFAVFLKKFGLPGDKKLPVAIWNSLLNDLIKSGYVGKAIPKTADGKGFVLAFKGKDGKVVREKLFGESIKGLKGFVEHAVKYMDPIAKRSKNKVWGFWSGTGAEAAAKATGGVSLEGSIGSLFDKYQGEWINFPAITGVQTLPLWAALSEAYAQKAAEHIDNFKFVGFLGPGATRDQSIFNKIEQPVFVSALKAKKQAQPKIAWFTVECVKNADDQWESTGKTTKHKSRTEALAEIKSKYGG